MASLKICPEVMGSALAVKVKPNRKCVIARPDLDPRGSSDILGNAFVKIYDFTVKNTKPCPQFGNHLVVGCNTVNV